MKVSFCKPTYYRPKSFYFRYKSNNIFTTSSFVGKCLGACFVSPLFLDTSHKIASKIKIHQFDTKTQMAAPVAAMLKTLKLFNQEISICIHNKISTLPLPMLYEILDFFRMPIAIVLSVLLVVIIANAVPTSSNELTIKTTSPEGTAQPWKVSPVEKTKTYVKSNLIQSIVIVPLTFAFNEILKMVGNSISN